MGSSASWERIFFCKYTPTFIYCPTTYYYHPISTGQRFFYLAVVSLAFKIDNLISDPLGIHHPLIFEGGGVIPGVWEPGETWHFVLQDYTNVFGKPASLLGSVGVPSAPGTFDSSSGSIIAIPEPATMILLAMGSVALVRRRRG